MHRVFFGHHKFASRFFRLTVFAKIARENDLELLSYRIANPPFHFRDLPRLDLDNVDFALLSGSREIVLNLLNSAPEVVSAVKAQTSEFRGLHVLRDPRQVLASAYFHHRGGHPINSAAGFVWDALAEDRPILQRLPVEDGLLYELDHITGEVLQAQIATWEPDDRILEERVEEINRDRPKFLRRLQEHLQIELMPTIDWDERFSDSGAGDWRGHFSPRVTAAFKERFGSLLISLGYEHDDDW